VATSLAHRHDVVDSRRTVMRNLLVLACRSPTYPALIVVSLEQLASVDWLIVYTMLACTLAMKVVLVRLPHHPFHALVALGFLAGQPNCGHKLYSATLTCLTHSLDNGVLPCLFSPTFITAQ
jgi:hypothetical protein